MDNFAFEDCKFHDAYVSIFHTMSVYHIALDQGEVGILSQVFSEDGVFERPDGSKYVGRTAIQQAVGSRYKERKVGRAPDAFQQHHLTTRFIDVRNPDEATAISYFQVTTEIGLDHCGTYFDTFARDSNRWLIKHRRITTHWIATDTRLL